MSLSGLMQTGLPLNRKERYFTGTVLPMIVCAAGFKDLHILASLMGCKLPPVEPDPAKTNIQFFTEYSLVESIYGAKTKARFPSPPKTKDTPDVIILVKGEERTILLALEAKMYHQPQAHALVTQMKAQKIQLDYLREHLHLDEVYHAALLPAAYARKIQEQILSQEQYAFPVVSWEDILDGYRPVRGEADYFLGMLDLALKSWAELASVPLAYGQNAEATHTGAEILSLFSTDPSIVIMGRAGGLHGPLLTQDVAADTWRQQTYEVSSASDPPNSNWFRVEDFMSIVEGRRFQPSVASPNVARPLRDKPPAKRYMTGEEIVAHWEVASVRVVGRQGGQSGRAFAEDVRTGRWRTWSYEVSDALRPPNKNWFTVERFLARVQAEIPRASSH